MTIYELVEAKIVPMVCILKKRRFDVGKTEKIFFQVLINGRCVNFY